MLLAPKVFKFSLEFILDAMQISKDEKIFLANFLNQSHLPRVLFVILAFSRTIGIFFF